MNRKDWLPTAHSVICIDNFEEKCIKRDKVHPLLCCGRYIQSATFKDSHHSQEISQKTKYLTR